MLRKYIALNIDKRSPNELVKRSPNELVEHPPSFINLEKYMFNQKKCRVFQGDT